VPEVAANLTVYAPGVAGAVSVMLSVKLEPAPVAAVNVWEDRPLTTTLAAPSGFTLVVTPNPIVLGYVVVEPCVLIENVNPKLIVAPPATGLVTVQLPDPPTREADGLNDIPM
jgi:hypothetical protein